MKITIKKNKRAEILSWIRFSIIILFLSFISYHVYMIRLSSDELRNMNYTVFNQRYDNYDLRAPQIEINADGINYASNFYKPVYFLDKIQEFFGIQQSAEVWTDGYFDHIRHFSIIGKILFEIKDSQGYFTYDVKNYIAWIRLIRDPELKSLVIQEMERYYAALWWRQELERRARIRAAEIDEFADKEQKS